MTRPESQPRHPLALLADGWEARARLLTENARAEQNEQSARYYAARAAEAQDCATQLREALRAQAEADVMAERDSLLSGLREAVQVWTQKRDSNRRDGDRRAGIIYGAVVSRALDILNDQETDEPALAQAGGES